MKKTWKGINSILARKSKRSKTITSIKDRSDSEKVTRDPLNIANVLNKHFASVGPTLGPVQTPNFSWAELNWNLDRPKLTKVRLSIQTSNLIRRTQFSLNQNWSKLLVKKPKTETACIIGYNNLCIRFSTWNVRRLNQSRSKGEISSWAVRNSNSRS